MRYFGEVKPSLDELLKHYGTKGMKWGVRKKKYASEEIHAARARQQKRIADNNAALYEAASAEKRGDSRAAARGLKRVQKTYNDAMTNEDRVIAAHMTRGEKVASLILGGPVGLAVVGANKIDVKIAARGTDKARRRLSAA